MTFLDELKEKRTTYAEMIDFCCDNCILNNDIRLRIIKLER